VGVVGDFGSILWVSLEEVSQEVFAEFIGGANVGAGHDFEGEELSDSVVNEYELECIDYAIDLDRSSVSWVQWFFGGLPGVHPGKFGQVVGYLIQVWFTLSEHLSTLLDGAIPWLEFGNFTQVEFDSGVLAAECIE
jgi:hypothetical protein